jgi:hypothetical protein
MTEEYSKIIEELFMESTSSIDETLDELNIRAINKEGFETVANKLMLIAYTESVATVKKYFN